MERKSEMCTLLMSVLMSAPGPLILAAGLMVGRSSTQIADFVRRSAELLALITTYVTCLLTTDRNEPGKKAIYERRANRFTGSMMCLGGGMMLVLALLSQNEAKGNVLISLVIAFLGVIANTLFWRKYTALDKANPNSMIAVQARLYRAKSLVDTCVVVALLSVHLFPGSSVSYYLDTVGSALVAVYLCWCGVKTMKENGERAKGKEKRAP